MIKAENISKRYGAHLALDNLSFEIEKGEICGFLGPNGAGKTSMMRILTGYMPPSSGRVSVAGFDTRENPMEVKRRIGYLPETTPLYPDMRVAEYLDFVAELKGSASRDERRRKVAEVMEVTRIDQRRQSLIRALSKGYRQRVGLAQALIGEPEVLVLDEPTIGLDPRQIVEIRSLIKDLAGKRTIILSSHILPEVQMICSRVLIINNGRLVASDTLKELSGKAGAKLTARIAGPAEKIIGELARIPGVARVETRGGQPGEGVYDMFPAPEADIPGARKALVKLAAANDWDVIELIHAAISLEETYIKLISGDDATLAPLPSPLYKEGAAYSPGVVRSGDANDMDSGGGPDN
jgi:ABC-2 type transport system ATP-binding protein